MGKPVRGEARTGQRETRSGGAEDERSEADGMSKGDDAEGGEPCHAWSRGGQAGAPSCLAAS